MICEFCGNSEANIHLVKIINGRAEKVNLCIDCLREFVLFPADEIFDDITKLLTKVFEIDIKIVDKSTGDKLFDKIARTEDRKCSLCGIDLNTIKATGRVGCANCYKDFREELMPIIKAIHESGEHKGKIPFMSTIDEKLEKDIRDLEHRLKEEVTVENFEEAARLRDTIRKLQKKLSISKKAN